MSALRQTLHLFWISLVAVFLVWGSVAPIAASPCGETKCCCCADSDTTPCSSSPADDCGCHWQAPKPPVMPKELFDPFSPPILLIAPIVTYSTVTVLETRQFCPLGNDSYIVPPTWRRYQSFCVYLI